MLLTASNIENPGTATSRTRRTAHDQPTGVGREKQAFASALRGPRGAPPACRVALVDRVRLQIANGTYETPAKIDALLPRLVKDLPGFRP